MDGPAGFGVEENSTRNSSVDAAARSEVPSAGAGALRAGAGALCEEPAREEIYAKITGNVPSPGMPGVDSPPLIARGISLSSPALVNGGNLQHMKSLSRSGSPAARKSGSDAAAGPEVLPARDGALRAGPALDEIYAKITGNNVSPRGMSGVDTPALLARGISLSSPALAKSGNLQQMKSVSRSGIPAPRKSGVDAAAGQEARSAGDGALRAGAAREEIYAKITGNVPPRDKSGVDTPSLLARGISLSSPALKSGNLQQMKSFNRSGTLPRELNGPPASEGTGQARPKGRRFWQSKSLKKSKSLDEVLASWNLLKPAKPKSPPMSGDTIEEVATEDEESGQDISLQRVPSYSNEHMSELGSERKVASMVDRHFEPGRRRITILSMDGGGMRGLIAARCLGHLESLLQAKTGGEVKICDYFDFLAGTSTGAILTLMISTPDKDGNPLFTGHGCCEFYARYGRDIFRPRWYDPWRGSLRQLYRPKFSPRRFERLLKKYLVRDGKALTMRETLRPFLVTSFDISQAAPQIFVKQAAMKDESRNFRLWEVCRGSAAAPTYFRPAEVTSVDGKISTTLIDGGAIQNNPSLVAMTHVLGNNEDFPEAVGLQDVLILSLGAGQLDERFDLKKVRKWGMAGWVRPLLNIMMDGSSDTIDYQLAAGFAGHNCAENYLRIQLSGLPNKTSLMDCASKQNIHDLIRCTDQLLQEKAVMRNEYGEKVTHPETYAERLSWFADQLIAQKKLRDQGQNDAHAPHLVHKSVQGLAATTRMVSPMYGHLFMHQQLHQNGLVKPIETAKSVRF